MTKKVLYNGKKYKVSFQAYGFEDSRFCINGEPTSFYMSDEKIINLDVFKMYAERAIKEYVAKKTAEKVFKEWNGKI
jgi:uncharacterized Fe-S cluster protein YjdI